MTGMRSNYDEYVAQLAAQSTGTIGPGDLANTMPVREKGVCEILQGNTQTMRDSISGLDRLLVLLDGPANTDCCEKEKHPESMREEVQMQEALLLEIEGKIREAYSLLNGDC